MPDTWRAYYEGFYSGCKAAEKDCCEGNDSYSAMNSLFDIDCLAQYEPSI